MNLQPEMKYHYIVLFSILHFLAIGQTNELKLASDVWPPFTNNFGKSAFAMMLVHEALSRADITATTQIVEFNDVIDGIRTREFDGSAALWRTTERETFMHYSNAYLENRLILIAAEGGDVSATSLQELTGKSVGIVGNYAYGEEIERAKGVKFVKGASDQANIDRLLAGELDYVLVDDLLVQFLIEQDQEKADRVLEIGSTPMIRRTLHFAVSKDLPDAVFIVRRFDEEIRAMAADGTYNRILQINWIQLDVDGDGYTEYVLGGTEAGTSAPQRGYSIMFDGTAENQNSENKYYIDGKMYNGWKNVPDSYKTPSAPRSTQPGIRLKN